jgi:hypothetical protein
MSLTLEASGNGGRAIRQTIINGSSKVCLARVAYKGRRRAKVCRTKDEARHAEGELLRDLKAEAAREEQEGARPATVKMLFEFYVADLEARGKSRDTIGRAAARARARVPRNAGRPRPRSRCLRVPPGPRPRRREASHDQS